MFDLLITNAAAVTATGERNVHIGVKDGIIAALMEPSVDLSPESARVIDAGGRIVVPGGIDPHVHTSWIIPTAASLGVASADAEHVSRAAAYGGTTTILDFAFCRPSDQLPQALERKGEEYGGRSFVDYSYHLTFMSGEIPFRQLEEIGDVIENGFPSFKVWMTNTTPDRPRQKTDLGYIFALLERTAARGGMLAVHAEDDEIVMYQYQRLASEGMVSFENVHLAHNQLSEDLAFRRIIRLAEYVGSPIYIMHVSAASGVEAIAEARARRQPVFGETLQHYLSFTHEDYTRPNGAVFHTYPSLKSEEDRLAVWSAVETGILSTVATDALCTDLAMKTRGKTIGDVTGGHVGVEVRMAVMFSEMVHKRKLPLTRFVETTSSNAARIFGLYPRKGVIAVGSDADLVIMDAFEPRPLSQGELHESDYSPWDGWLISAWPAVTLLRGVPLIMNGDLVERAGKGVLVPRKLLPDVLSGPAC